MDESAIFSGILVGGRSQQSRDDYVAILITHLPEGKDINALLTLPTSAHFRLEHLMSEIAETDRFKSAVMARDRVFTIVNLPYDLIQTSLDKPIRFRPLTQYELMDLVQLCGEAIKKYTPPALND